MRRRFQDLSPGRQKLLAALVMLTACALLALMAEGVVRLRHWVKYGTLWGIEETYTTDSQTGLRVPVASAAFGPIQINSLGFRSPEIQVPKPASTIRIAFLGASTTYCAEVSSNEMTWPHLVWHQLSQRWKDVDIDYINGGVPGYNLKSSLKNFERRIVAFSPDVVVIYHATNDLAVNTLRMAVDQGLAKGRTEDERSWLSQYSLLIYLVEKNLAVLARRYEAASPKPKLAVDSRDFASPFRSDLESLVRRAQRTAKLIVLVTFSQQLRAGQSHAKQAQAAATALYYMPYMSIDGLIKAFDAYNTAIREVAAASGSLLIDGEDLVPADDVHFSDSVHFTDTGSKVMAQRVLRGLQRSAAFESLVRLRLQ